MSPDQTIKYFFTTLHNPHLTNRTSSMAPHDFFQNLVCCGLNKTPCLLLRISARSRCGEMHGWKKETRRGAFGRLLPATPRFQPPRPFCSHQMVQATTFVAAGRFRNEFTSPSVSPSSLLVLPVSQAASPKNPLLRSNHTMRSMSNKPRSSQPTLIPVRAAASQPSSLFDSIEI